MQATKILLGVLILSLSSYAFAGIKDKKAIRDSETKITTAAASVKTACGNAKLDTKVDWAQWDKYDYEALGRKKDVILRFAGGVTEKVLSLMVSLCEDADYKAEVAKITSLKISGKADQSESHAAFTLNGSTLDIKLNADGSFWLKNEDLLKAVWE